MGQFINLDRYVDPAAEGREPFGPTTLVPKSIRFDKTDDRINRRKTGQREEVRVVQPRHRRDKDLRIMLGRIELEMTDDLLGELLVIPAKKTKQAEASDKDNGTLQRLEQGDGTESFVSDR